MIAKIGRTLPALLAFLGLLAIDSTAQAQGNTFNPYGNSGYADYREFGNPMMSNNPALPGQALLNSAPSITRQRANSFQQYSNDLEGADTDNSASRRGASSNLPYYQAYQRLNSQYNRVYQANNNDADRKFNEQLKKRDADFAKAIAEVDPAKRAKLLRQVEQDSIGRISSARNSSATKKAAAPKPAVVAPSTTARSVAPVERRMTAPSPFGNDTVRRQTGTRVPVPGRTGTVPPPATSTPNAGTRPAPAASSAPTPPTL